MTNNARWLGAGALMMFLSSFGQTFFISLFSEQIRTDFDLTDGDWGLVYTIGTMTSAILLVWMGTLADRLKAGTLSAAVLVCLAIACLTMAWADGVVGLVIAVLLLRLFGQGMATHTAVVAMSRWFVATRGRALAICNVGFTIGEALLPIIIVSLTTIFVWTSIWVACAGFVLLGVPVVLWLLALERHPNTVQVENELSAGMQDLHWTRADALRHPLFWFMVPAILGPSTFVTAFFFHQVRFSELKEISHLFLVSLFPIYTITSVGWMMLSGWAIDRWGSARLLPVFQLPMAAAFIVLAFGHSLAWLVIGLLLMSVTTGANSTLPNAFWSEFFGTRHIGAIKALATSVMVLGSAIGPGLTGLLMDSGMRLDAQFAFVSLFFLISSSFVWIGVRRYVVDVARYRDLRR